MTTQEPEGVGELRQEVRELVADGTTLDEVLSLHGMSDLDDPDQEDEYFDSLGIGEGAWYDPDGKDPGAEWWQPKE